MISQTSEGGVSRYVQYNETVLELHSRRQGSGESLKAYYEGMLTLSEVAVAMEIVHWDEIAAKEFAKAANRSRPTDSDHAAARSKILAVIFIENAWDQRYAKRLRVSFLEGKDEYPKTIHDAYHIMKRFNDLDQDEPAGMEPTDGVALLNQASSRRCWKCGSDEHRKRGCPSSKKADSTAATVRQPENPRINVSTQASRLPNTVVLLGSQSSIDLFCNSALLSNIRTVSPGMTVTCNAGKVKVTQKGDLAGYGSVWYYPDGVANILSLGQVGTKAQFDVDYIHGGPGQAKFILHKPDGTKREFVCNEDHLYVCDSLVSGPFKTETGVTLVTTVADNRNSYTSDDYSRAVRARSLQVKLGRPSLRDFIRIVTTNQQPNCPVTNRTSERVRAMRRFCIMIVILLKYSSIYFCARDLEYLSEKARTLLYDVIYRVLYYSVLYYST